MSYRQKFTLDKQFRYFFAYLGINESELLQAAQLPHGLFNQKSVLLTADEYFRLLGAGATLDKHETPLPLRMLDIPLFSMMSPPVMAALCAPDFQACVYRLQEYKPLIGPLRLILHETAETFSVEITAIESTMQLHRQVVATELIFFVAMMRHSTGKRIHPIQVESTVALEHPGYSDYLGCGIEITDHNRITFSLKDSKTPFKLRNDSAWDFFEPEMRKQLSELEQDDSFAAAVRASLMELLPMGQATMDDVAGKLFVSTRTLQRKLKHESTTFQAQLNHSRELLARHYLKNSEMSVTEIAFLIGYHEPSSFTRAFSGWTGIPPEQFRSSDM